METAKQHLIDFTKADAEAARTRAARCRLLADYVAGGKQDMLRIAAAEDQMAELYEKMVASFENL